MKERILSVLQEALPTVDFNSDFLFGELDSIGVVTILITLTKKFDINLTSNDVTPKNFRNIDAITAMVESKLVK